MRGRRCHTAVGILLLAFASSNVAAGGDGPSATLGAGAGIPYGMFGVNGELEVPLGQYVSLGPTIGVGVAGPAGLGWNVGLQARFLSSQALFRPGLSVWYGTNTLVEKVGSGWGDPEFETRTGATVGLNGRFQFGTTRIHCLDLFLLYPVTRNLDSDEYDEEGPVVKVGVGYAHRF